MGAVLQKLVAVLHIFSPGAYPAIGKDGHLFTPSICYISSTVACELTQTHLSMPNDLPIGGTHSDEYYSSLIDRHQ